MEMDPFLFLIGPIVTLSGIVSIAAIYLIYRERRERRSREQHRTSA